jgi:histidyl-tRNA synthetase
MKEKFTLEMAKGTRDFPPEEKIIRDKLINTIKGVFENYGYNPIELPILERYETLAAKYAAGEESDALKEIFTSIDNGERKLGLRFDLTVPFSRFIGMNPELKMPFKKYIMGQVFRDGPMKKGRYREFMQFDPDIVGCKSVIADAEILAIVEDVFSRLGFGCVIEVNNRKIITGIMEDLDISEKKQFDVIVSVDKLKKIGESGVEAELLAKDMGKKEIALLFKYLKTYDSFKDTLDNLKKLMKSKTGIEGIDEMEELFSYLQEYKLKDVKFIPSLARGLAYYTGPVYEAFLVGSTLTSSAAGGGRYDKMIGNFLGGEKEVPATGVSFGIEVLVEAMKEREKLVQKSLVKAYLIPIKTTKKCISIAQKLRKAGINTDMDLQGKGISNNLDYANSYGIPYVIFAGERELAEGKVKLRDMKTGKEEILSVETAIEKLKD